ncbi:M23 family metallopeptidase [Burkholderia vietnamiensis]|uniref:M23 family metallopeptidase n=1 Tax=Burkholderia vietnamiensis TaxID=60552 RepID=UPI000AC65065|nr:M23 family metallopeptidase [Burkholderia vietnamiensis]
MDELDKIADSGGIYPIAFDRRWHTGVHLVPSNDRSLPVRAIADGEVVAYGVYQKPIADVFDDKNTNAGFVLLKHSTETGENRKLTFYSLYMHLLDLDGMTTDGIQPPAVNEPHSMSDWLRHSTGAAVSGGGRKVRRKDILGYTGRCQNKRHLHFEIFMTPSDFDGYFGATQLGHQQVETSQGSDCWGRSYYVIPANQTFRAQPPGVDAHHKLHGIQFAPKQEGQNEHPLYVEVYFNKGDKFTNVWSIAADGSRMLLTPAPVCEAQFEYDLYKRATALYSFCASDGYEMLRFGRILSQPATLPPIPDQETPATLNPRATWYCIPFASGQQGYIDISKSSIKKLSDADFPFFMGWRKIQAQTAPVDQNGLWDLDKLKALVRASIGNVGAAGSGAPVALQTAQQKNESMRHYISDPDHKAVQQLLHGFICEAPSEWDSANLEPRYRNLLDEGEHFEGNQNAYNKFLEFVKKLQFWDKTGLPVGGNFWFFHPLAFIRHFRRCGWISANELARTMPKFPFYGRQGNIYIALKSSAIYIMDGENVKTAQQPYVNHLNRTIIKYGLGPLHRRALFLAQVNWETAQWRNLTAHPIMHEWGYGAYNTGNPATQYYAAFYGRGAMQLTWSANYRDYGNFCGTVQLPNHAGVYSDHLSSNAPRITATSTHWTVAPSDHGTQMTWAPRFDPNVVADDPFHACNSAGFYWVSKPFQAGINISRKADQPWSYQTVQNVSRGVNGGGNGKVERQAYSAFAAHILLDSVINHREEIINTPVGTIRVDFAEIQ